MHCLVSGLSLYLGETLKLPQESFLNPCCAFQTGGQDDLVTIYSPWEQRVVARCQGHSSFVSALAFDEIRCDGRTYRFGSVGEDNKLILVRTFALRAIHELNPFPVGLFEWGLTSTQAACKLSGLLLLAFC